MFSSGWCEETVKTVNSNRENVQSAHDCQAKNGKFVQKNEQKRIDFHGEMVYNICIGQFFVFGGTFHELHGALQALA